MTDTRKILLCDGVKVLSVSSATHRLLSSYRGPIIRVRFADGRDVDVYDDSERNVPEGALRFCDLPAASNGAAVRILFMYEQAL